MLADVAIILQNAVICTPATFGNKGEFRPTGVQMVYESQPLAPGRSKVLGERVGLFRACLSPSDPPDAVGPFFWLDASQFAVYSGDEGTEVLIAEGVGDEDATCVGRAGSGQRTYQWQEVSDVGGDKHPTLRDGEIQNVFVVETFEVLFRVYGVDVVAEVPESTSYRPARKVGIQEQAGQYSMGWTFRLG